MRSVAQRSQAHPAEAAAAVTFFEDVARDARLSLCNQMMGGPYSLDSSTASPLGRRRVSALLRLITHTARVGRSTAQQAAVLLALENGLASMQDLRSRFLHASTGWMARQ